MLVHDDYLYAVSDTGRALCWRASDGREMWKVRIGRGGVMASPVLANGMIFAAMKNGSLTVFKASGESYQKIAVNKLGDDAYASPVIVDDEIFLRVGFRNEGERKEVLYCLGRG